MEKVPNKYALPIRIICYILIPICMLAIVQSTISILYFAEQKQNKIVIFLFISPFISNFAHHFKK